jgi:phosphonoacetate hydrolase
VTAVEVNGRTYRVPPAPVLVICIDGCDPAYVWDAFDRGLAPRIREMGEGGALLTGLSQVPSFTNPNNLSIVTGAPPAVHGIPGNHYLAPDGEEVQLTAPALLRAPSIHAAFRAAGVPVLAVTTKRKLSALLGCGGVPCLSVEGAASQTFAGRAVEQVVGAPAPGIYDWDASLYAVRLALAVAPLGDARLVYISLTDYVQHAEPPGGALSDAYWRGLDGLVARGLDAEYRVGLVADHGMNDKATADGTPNVRYLDDVLAAHRLRTARTVLPITDPYVVHHGALGSACWVHVGEGERRAASEVLLGLDGVEEVVERDVAASRFTLPPDRIGDLLVLADARTVLGSSAAAHDLSGLRGRLRSHGGLHERRVPIVLSTRAGRAVDGEVSNADVHDLLLNG